MLSRRLLIVDDQPLFRQGMREILHSCQLVRVAGEAGTTHQALQLAVQTRPHLAIVSEALPGLSGLTLISSLANLRPPCASLALVGVIDQRSAGDARRAGAAGVISRGIEPHDLRTVIERTLTRSAASMRRDEARAREIALPLSPRELEILDCVAQGFTNREIANALFVTEQTVKNHMTSVFRKLEVEDRVQALLAAVRRGWVTFGMHTAYDSSHRKSA
ncbi:MAG: LuxR C-terminal-related transcriptional regulator [Planctomycetaceae bacterium]